jgi:tetratricopeptide (TPR) repeat protein
MYEWYDGAATWLGRAIEMNQKALEIDPASVDARFGIAMVYFHQGRLPEAKRNLLAVVQSDPMHVPAHLRLGMIAERMGDLKEARSRYAAAAEFKPHDDDPWRFLAALHQKMGNTEAAQSAAINVIESVARKLEASLDDVVLMARLAESYARFGGKEETHAILRQVLTQDASDALALYYSACAHALLGETAQAIHMLHKAYESGFRAVAHSAKADSAFDGIKEAPEFTRLVAELQG